MYKSKWQTVKEILCAIGIVVIICIVIFALAYHITESEYKSSRIKSGMILIEQGIVYNENTGVIYIETLNSNGNSYTPYLNSDGNYCTYNTSTGEFESIEK